MGWLDKLSKLQPILNISLCLISQIVTRVQYQLLAAKYKEKLKVAKEHLKELEKSDRDTYNKLKDLSDRELMDAFYPTEMGEYKRMKSTFLKTMNKWLCLGGDWGQDPWC